MTDQPDRSTAASSIAGITLSQMSRDTHKVMIEMSHLASFVIERLRLTAIGQGIGKAEIPLADLDAVYGLLREIQNSGHVAFLRAYGSENDFQSVRSKVAKRLRIPAKFQGGS
jgi:hypothetical protein